MRKIVLFLLLALLCAPRCACTDVSGELTAAFGVDRLNEGLPESAAAALDGSTPLSPGNAADGAGSILKNALPDTAEALRSTLRSAAAMLAVVVLCGMAAQTEGGVSERTARLAGTLGILLIGTTGLRSVLGVGKETLEELQSFSKLLMPPLAAAAAAGGAPTAATALSAAAMLVSDVLMTAIDRLLAPLVCAFLAVAAADALLGNHALTQLRALLKWAVSWGMKGAVCLFTGYLALTRLVSGTADETMGKAVKLAVSAAVPVVGGMISDASETVLLSAQTIRNSVGVFGMLAVLAICVAPLLRLLVRYLVLRLTAAVCGPIGDRQLTGMIGAVGEAAGMLAGMTGACGFLLLISCACFLRAAGV